MVVLVATSCATTRTSRDVDEPLQSLQGACDRGDSSRCAVLGVRLLKAGTNPAEAMRVLTKGCELNNAAACLELGAAYLRQARLIEARAALSRSCQIGNAVGCETTAGLVFVGEGGPKDSQLAATLLDRACKLRKDATCERLKLHTAVSVATDCSEGDGLEKETIGAVMKQNSLAIASCYDRALFDDDTLAGKVLLAFEIHSQGEVLNARVEQTTLMSSAVERCIVKRASAFVFPRPCGGGVVNVTFPYIFKVAKN